MRSIVSGKEKQHVSVCSLVDEYSRNSKIFMEDGNFKPRVGKYSRTAGVQIVSCRTRVRLQVLELNSFQYPGSSFIEREALWV